MPSPTGPPIKTNSDQRQRCINCNHQAHEAERATASCNLFTPNRRSDVASEKCEAQTKEGEIVSKKRL